LCTVNEFPEDIKIWTIHLFYVLKSKQGIIQMTATLSRYAGACRDAEQQQDQCQASAAVVTLAANPRAHQIQSCHSDVQGSSVVNAAVSEFAAARLRFVSDSPTIQHAAFDRTEDAHRTCQASVLGSCTCSVEQSTGRCC